MSTMNPYDPPQQAYGPMPNVAHEANADYSSAVASILESMQRTRPWVTMFAVLSFVGGAFLVLGALGMFFAGAASGLAGGPAMFFGPGLGLVYLFFSAFYFVIGWLLWSYRTSIGTFLASGGGAGLLAAALDKQASFWKFVGILSLVGMVLYGILLVVGIGAAVSGFR